MSSLRKFIYGIGLALFTIVSVPTAHALAFTQIYAFGDSLSDDGNFSALTNGGAPGSNFYYAWKSVPPAIYPDVGLLEDTPLGRFSNRPVAVEVLANQLGVPLIDLAIAGAKTGPDAAGNDHVAPTVAKGWGMLSQVEKFKTGFTTGGSADSEALYVLWGGPNDFESSTLLSGTETVDAVIDRAVGNLGDMINDLATIGARNFLVPGILDLGNTAKFLQPQYDDNLRLALTEGSKDFNSQLMKKINELETANQAIDIRYFDVFGLMTAIRNNPSAYGFTNVTDQCFVFPNPPCAEPDSYLFWEGIHPSAAFHEQLAAGFAAAVPEPGTLTLLGLGVLGLAFSRRAKTIVSTDLGCDFS